MNDIKDIAVVDGDVLVRKGLASLINLFSGYTELLDAGNGKELISLMQQSPLPDIVLLDVVMPQMDGYATAEWLHQNHPDIRVLALSTMDAESAIIKMIKCGAKGYVLKDADPQELRTAFDEVLSRGYYYNDTVSRKVLSAVHQLTESKNPVASFANLSGPFPQALQYGNGL